jgi:hypothetical protein
LPSTLNAFAVALHLQVFDVQAEGLPDAQPGWWRVA